MQPIRPRLIGATSLVIGATELTPVASHLFALLLALALEPRAAWTRRSLQELLFGVGEELPAAHRLRQLLYRLRGFGLVLEESPAGVITVLNPVSDPLDEPEAATHGAAVAWDDAALPAVLPLYAPRLPETYLEWLDEQRARLVSRLTAGRAAALRAARDRQDWSHALQLALALRDADPLHEEWSQAAAEAQAMLGRRDDALETIDRFVRETGTDAGAWPALKRLRARIATTRMPRREGTLRGREECMIFLADQWEQACSDEGARLCVVTGASGIGKTRLGSEFASGMSLRRGHVLRFACDNHTQAIPNALFSDLVPRLRELRGSAGVEPRYASVLNRLAQGNETLPQEEFTPDVAALRSDDIARAITDLLEAVSAEQPLMILVDDAHLLDSSSHSVLRAITASASRAHLLFVLLARPLTRFFETLSTSTRVSTYSLSALTPEAAERLLMDIRPNIRDDAGRFAWTLAQAGGNPFYLTTLAQADFSGAAVSAHVLSSARLSYYGLSAVTRTVLESCLLLGRYATLARIEEVADVDSSSLLEAVRDLADNDLLQFANGVLRGPHDILSEALLSVVSSPVRALLNARIACRFDTECLNMQCPTPIAHAAIHAWLEAGDIQRAFHTAIRCSRILAARGSTAASAALLALIPHDALAPDDQRVLLDELILLADSVGSGHLLARTLETRVALALQQGESPDIVARLQLHIVISTMYHLGPSQSFRSTLESIAKDPAVSQSVRLAACNRLLVWADLFIDQELAHYYYTRLQRLAVPADPTQLAHIQGRLVFHTVFGDPHEAKRMSHDILAIHPAPTVDPSSRPLRNYAAYSLMRIGYYAEAACIAREDFDFYLERGMFGLAQYAATLAAEADFNSGSFDTARQWLMRVEDLTHRTTDAPLVLTPSYYGTMGHLALLAGDLAEAERHNGVTSRAARDVPRLRCVAIADRVRIQLRGNTPISHGDIAELTNHYERARAFGGQDTIVLALWNAHQAVGETESATALLTDYLIKFRREHGTPEWTLISETKDDKAWALVQSQKAAS